MNDKRPFNREYVISLTAKAMVKAVDFSIAKTIARIEEFANDPQKSREVFQTLSDLHQMKKGIEQ